MTNIFGSDKKVQRRDRLFEIGLETLEREGYKVERVQGAGKSSLRRILKGGASKLVSIRTGKRQATRRCLRWAANELFMRGC